LLAGYGFLIFFTCFEIRVLFIFLSIAGFVSVCWFFLSRNEVLICFYSVLLVFVFLRRNEVVVEVSKCL
jgi:hypothetical protein